MSENLTLSMTRSEELRVLLHLRGRAIKVCGGIDSAAVIVETLHEDFQREIARRPVLPGLESKSLHPSLDSLV